MSTQVTSLAAAMILVNSTPSVPDYGMVSEYVVENFSHQYVLNTVIRP